MGTEHLKQGKIKKDDEFYTYYEDIEIELLHYKEQLRNKTIYCPCDAEWSNFFKYFYNNFEKLELKKLITSNYSINDTEIPTKFIKTKDYEERISLNGNGSFDSEECIELLKESDIVITNPPFSLFRQFIDHLVSYDKKFLVIGSLNSMSCKNIFNLFKNKKISTGYKRVLKFSKNEKEANIASLWFTNLEVKEKDYLILSKKYEGNEKDYPNYINYDAINCNKLSDIPCDYKGEIGVPLTILEKLNHNQFEIIGNTLKNKKIETIRLRDNEFFINCNSNLFIKYDEDNRKNKKMLFKDANNGDIYNTVFKRVIIKIK